MPTLRRTLQRQFDSGLATTLLIASMAVALWFASQGSGFLYEDSAGDAAVRWLLFCVMYICGAVSPDFCM